MSTVTVGPRDFIRGPYRLCPACGSEAFGIWVVGRHHYSRRCRECLFQGENQLLPQLDKKVVYLDQFATSNMMKSLNPSTEAHKQGRLDPFFRELFDLLYRLCRSQLVVCPTSFFHTWESLPSPFCRPLEQFCELLSCNVKFRDPHTIRRFQLVEHARNWLQGNPHKPVTPNVQDLVSGTINSWPPVLSVRANIKHSPDTISELKRWRNSTHQGLIEVFERWRRDTNKQFSDWFAEESSSYGSVTLQVCHDYAKEYFKSISTGALRPDTPEAVTIVHDVQQTFLQAGVPDREILPRIFDYFLSQDLKEVPAVKISSMLYAAIARKARAGQKRPPNRGMGYDIEAISVLLPYCDAMFVDKECHALLKEKPLCDSIDYGTRIFSLNNKQEFLDFLNQFLAEAPKSLLETARDVYGV